MMHLRTHTHPPAVPLPVAHNHASWESPGRARRRPIFPPSRGSVSFDSFVRERKPSLLLFKTRAILNLTLITNLTCWLAAPAVRSPELASSRLQQAVEKGLLFFIASLTRGPRGSATAEASAVRTPPAWHQDPPAVAGCAPRPVRKVRSVGTLHRSPCVPGIA